MVNMESEYKQIQTKKAKEMTRLNQTIEYNFTRAKNVLAPEKRLDLEEK